MRRARLRRRALENLYAPGPVRYVAGAVTYNTAQKRRVVEWRRRLAAAAARRREGWRPRTEDDEEDEPAAVEEAVADLPSRPTPAPAYEFAFAPPPPPKRNYDPKRESDKRRGRRLLKNLTAAPSHDSVADGGHVLTSAEIKLF